MSYCIVLYWFEAAPPAAADKGFARFRSYVPNLMVAVLCEARWSQLSGLPLSRSYAMSNMVCISGGWQMVVCCLASCSFARSPLPKDIFVKVTVALQPPSFCIIPKLARHVFS